MYTLVDRLKTVFDTIFFDIQHKNMSDKKIEMVLGYRGQGYDEFWKQTEKRGHDKCTGL